jgi:hypothetical protein
VKHTKARVLVAAALAALILQPLTAQEKEGKSEPAPLYSLGDQTLAISGGMFVPLYFLSYAGAAAPTQLSLGGMGSLQWQAYLSSMFRIGLEVGGVFAFSPNMNVLLMLPVTAKVSYVMSFYPFEVPLSLGLGMNVVKYSDQSNVNLLVKPGASFFWIFNSSWSFGLNAVYWWDMQFAPTADQSRIGNFLEVSLTALYHY